MRNALTALWVAAAIVFPTAASSAATVVGGDTRVVFSSAISGLSVGLTGSATLVGGAPGLTVNFGITGGELDAALAGTILHDGSGLTLSNGVNTLALGNFVIDTSQSLLRGDVSLNGGLVGTGLDLFSFDLSTVSVAELTNLSNPLLDLFITSTTAGALTTAFSLGDTTGVVIGRAATAPVLAAGVIPEPASWTLLIAGFGLVGMAVRRRGIPRLAA
jgi:hypothetical protein